MSSSQQRKGADGEKELTSILRRAGYPVSWGGNKTYGAVPDVSGLPGIHIEVKRRERLNITEAMEQAERDADRFRDGAPAVFHRKNKSPWLVTMKLSDWLPLYALALTQDHDHDAHARFFTYDPTSDLEKGAHMEQSYWETENPVEVDTGKNVLRYFPEARKLHISKLGWTDKKTGEHKMGKTVALDLDAVASTPAGISLLETVVKNLKTNM